MIDSGSAFVPWTLFWEGLWRWPGRNSSPHSALANDARYSDGSEAMNITQENAETWKSWLEKKQTRIDRKQEWGDKSKIGIGSW